MGDEQAQYVSGLLLEWPGGSLKPSHIARTPGMEQTGRIPGTHWEEYRFQSSIALHGEDRLDLPGPYQYVLVARRSGQRMLLLGPHRDVVTHIVYSVLNRELAPALRRVSIAVDDLVKAVTVRPTVYVLSFVHCRVPAFGASLRSMSFYGDDLAEASLFSDNVRFMNIFTCGLRRAVGGPELVRLSGDGVVSFYLSGPDRIRDVEEVLGFLRAEGYLSTDMPGAGSRPQ